MSSRFGVSPQKNDDLLRRMNRLGLRETDLVEKFVRSSGPGGQHVNKTSTCVYLKHLPSGIEVKIQAGRSQALNRFLARRAIVETLESQKAFFPVRIAGRLRKKSKRPAVNGAAGNFSGFKGLKARMEIKRLSLGV